VSSRRLIGGHSLGSLKTGRMTGRSWLVVKPGRTGVRMDVERRRTLVSISTGEAPYDPGAPAEITVDFNTSDHVEEYR
jgi:hypothetical protein